MANAVRLQVAEDAAAGATHCVLTFAAPADQEDGYCAPAYLILGNGVRLDLGELCAPTAFTWHADHDLDLAPWTAEVGEQPVALHWGAKTIQATPFPAPPSAPALHLFAAEPQASEGLSVHVRLEVAGLQPDQRLRLDNGAGETRWVEGGGGADQSVSWLVEYSKPGEYTVAVDLVDAGGFWQATLGQCTVAVTGEAVTAMLQEEPTVTPGAVFVMPPPEVPLAAASSSPWLPYRYARPAWAGARMVTRPGGHQVSRSLLAGTYLAIDTETLVNGALWYRSTRGDWIAASAVTLVRPSELRGVELEPPTPPPPGRRGVVTAKLLNVRARPGVRADNPVVDQLPYGAEVTIYGEQTVDGARWYRIGADRWVHSQWVRLIETRGLAQGASTTASLPVGWVVSSSLNVRARPGVSADNPVIGQVAHNQRLNLLETRSVGGDPWYRIGDGQWVLGQWVAAARLKSRPSRIGASERWVGVNLSQQTAVAYEGDRPVYAAMVASGLPGTPTVQGVFRTWKRLRSGKMSGGSPNTGGYYYLEEVTWTCYFYSGYALHTAYWHDAFGRPRSHGCVNLSPYDAWWIYQWSAAGGSHSPAVYAYWS